MTAPVRVAVLGLGRMGRTHVAALRALGPAVRVVSVADVDGSADEGVTVARNRAAYGWLHVRPRVLVDVETISTECRLLNRVLSSPIVIAPTAMQRLAHPDGELATARAAACAN